MSDIPKSSYNSTSATQDPRARWWYEDDPSQHVIAAVNAIESRQGGRQAQSLRCARLFANRNLSSLYETGLVAAAVSVDDGASPLGHRVTWNAVRSCISTAAAKISKNKPRVLYLTSGGDWEQQQRAKQLTKFTDGLFYESDIYRHTSRAFVDACVWDAGVVKVYVDDDGKVRGERVLPFEIVVDDNESVYGEPRSLYQRKFVHRDVLLDAWGSGTGDKAERVHRAIEAARGGDPAKSATASDMVPVVEAWHLGGKSGRHVIVVDGATLVDEKWTKDYFPFAVFHWDEPLVGFWGEGIASQLIGVQIEINKLLRTIQRAQHLMSVPRVYIERGSKIVSQHLNNDIGAITEYSGTAPQEHVAQAMSSEVYQHLDRLWNRAFEIVGISQMDATSLKPAGLDAAVAIREYHDVNSERFVKVGQRFEAFHLEIARIMIDLTRDLHKAQRKVTVRAPGKRFVETIDWARVNLPEDECVMQTFPVSILPSTPAGRLQKVQEMYEAGFVDREMALDLLDFPDLEGALSLQLAATDDIKRILGNIIERGEYETPEPAMNLQLALRLAQSAYLKARNDGVPEKRRELLLRFIDDLDALVTRLKSSQQPEQPQPPQQPQPPMPPEAGGPAPMPGTEALPSELSALPVAPPAA